MITADGFDLMEIWQSGEINLNQILVSRPKLSASLEAGGYGNSRIRIPDALQNIQVKELHLAGGEIDLLQGSDMVVMKDLNIQMKDLQLIEKGSLANWDQEMYRMLINASKSKFFFNDDELEIGYFSYLPGERKLLIDNLYYNDSETGSNYEVMEFSLKGFNTEVFDDHNVFHFDSLLVNGANIDYLLGESQASSNWIEDLLLDYGELRSINLNIHSPSRQIIMIDSMDVILDHFAYDSLAGFWNTTFMIEMDTVSVDLDSLNHHIQASNLHISEIDSTIFFERIAVNPLYAVR
jgi:hypothetical protein